MGDWSHLFTFGWLTYYLFVKVRGHAVVVAVDLCVNAKRCPHIHQPILGVTEVTPFYRKIFALSLTKAIEMAVTDKQMKNQTIHLSRKIQKEDGIACAVQHIEAYLKNFS